MNDIQVRGQVEKWMTAFEKAISAKSTQALKELFAEVSYFRDNGVLTWDFRQFHGRDAVLEALVSVADEIRPHNFRISESWPVPHFLDVGGSTVVEAFLDFDTANGAGVALFNGIPDEQSPFGFKVRALYTRLESLNEAPQPELHPRGSGFTPDFPGQTWKEHHTRRRQFVDHDPEVLIVGAGQAGLVAAAHLEQLGVSPLIIDRNERVGDNWYKRYGSLVLHNPVEMNGFPFLPFPRHYPEYLPKDVVGQWLEIYAQYLDLNVWTSTEFLDAKYDDKANQWTATIKLADGSTRVLHPRHIILATGGIGGKPSVPELPGLSTFKGKVFHSASYTQASELGAKKAIIVGVATSAHDIAGDLYKNGVEVTMLQRSPVVVCNVDTANLAYAGYIDPNIPTELVDIRYGIGLINPIREYLSQSYHKMATGIDAELLKGLTAAGLHLGDGVNGMGWLDLFLRTGGGYYLNKGTSEIIVDGGIKIKQFARVVEFVPDGVKLDDGSIIEADLVVLATGYQNRKVEVAEWFGQDVAERVGDIATLDAEGEWANIWGQTGQRGLWLNGGGINQIRPGSKRLALLVKADLDGLITERFRRPPKNSVASAVYEPAA
ncbi:flavin-containing monooxygenase [Agrobacterium radiobacter]|uniref:flavin-containing monooxygenase n=1 Tax=Agrobacterium radiobacter TaxID=362 RepID=UPI003F85EF49